MIHTKKNWMAGIAASLAAMSLLAMAPSAAMAQRWRHDDNRQRTKNEWRNLAIAAGGVAAYGALRKDPTVGFLGAAGALYSLNRYEQDRKSQNSRDRARARMFDNQRFYRDGSWYERRTINQGGQRYYQWHRR